MVLVGFGRLLAPLALALVAIPPAHANGNDFAAQFDSVIGSDTTPRDFTAHYNTALERQVAALTNNAKGRIGVAAFDLTTGQQISVLGNQRFPLASTSKVAIVATFLEGVDQGRWSLDDKFPLLVPVPSARLSGTPAPLREGKLLTARDLIELAITRSNNEAPDGLLRVVGGPKAVNDWMRRAGIRDFSIDRYIATLVRDDGEFDPASHIDMRDSATPLAMVNLLRGLYQGRWLSASSRNVLIGAMERCKTGPQRIPGQMPDGVLVAHKTGSLWDTSSDVGIVTSPDGHAIAMAIYVTGGNNNHRYRFEKIGTIARAIYDGYRTQPAQVWASADYGEATAAP
jgi:beta-lactamase class A